MRRDQALALGISDDAIRHRISREGRWQRVLPGLYATFRGELSAQDRCRAAVLYAGADAQLTGPTALRQFRVRYLPQDDGSVHVLVAHATSRQDCGFVAFTRTTRLPRPWWRDGLPWTPVARAAVETCRDMRELRAVRALMAEVVQRKLAGVRQLEHELAAGESAGSALPRRALEDVGRGCRSAPECELRDLLRTSRFLPEPLWNATVLDDDGRFVGVPDGWWPAIRLALEVNSREHHLYGDSWERTMDRQARFAAAGILVIPLFPGRIRRDGPALLREIESAYLRLQPTAGLHDPGAVTRAGPRVEPPGS